jgi:hypothetical protein
VEKLNIGRMPAADSDFKPRRNSAFDRTIFRSGVCPLSDRFTSDEAMDNYAGFHPNPIT